MLIQNRIKGINHRNWTERTVGHGYVSFLRGTALMILLLAVFVLLRGPSMDDYGSPSVSAQTDTKRRLWDPAKCAVIALATGYGLDVYRIFVGSLRATGYPGHIILGISPDAPENVRSYLKAQNVTTKEVALSQCTFYNTTTVNNGLYTEPKCSKDYPDYKIQWGRFPLARDWLRQCENCTDGVMLTDALDAYFQADPFKAVIEPHPIMVFEEIYPNLTTEHWLTDIPVSRCKNYKFGPKPMLCSGSTMGTHQGILDYIDAMVREFDLWKVEVNCRSEMVGDDQSIHNYLYYSGQLPDAVAIPHRTGPIHVVGVQAALINRAAIKKKAEEGNMTLMEAEGWVNNHGFVEEETFDGWRNWLPSEQNLTDPRTGYILNLDGSPSPQVHQFDRFGPSFRVWLSNMVKEWHKLKQSIE